MSTMASQITSLMIVYSIIYSGADQRKHKSSASLAFVRGIHRWPVNSPREGPVTRKMFPFDDVIMHCVNHIVNQNIQTKHTRAKPQQTWRSVNDIVWIWRNPNNPNKGRFVYNTMTKQTKAEAKHLVVRRYGNSLQHCDGSIITCYFTIVIYLEHTCVAYMRKVIKLLVTFITNSLSFCFLL